MTFDLFLERRFSARKSNSNLLTMYLEFGLIPEEICFFKEFIDKKDHHHMLLL